MRPDTAAPRAVLLAGTGSDEHFTGRVFAAALGRRGLRPVLVVPEPADLLAGQVRALDEAAAAPGPLLVGGISLGAATALGWALAHPRRVDGVLVALPGWTGPSGDAPAALSARHSATRLRAVGLEAVLAEVAAGTPGWLAAELGRAWRRQWPHLPDALDAAAAAPAPDLADLAELDVPVGLVAAVDDPVHPWAVAEQLGAAVPRAGLARIRLADLGSDPAAVGEACLAAWERAAQEPGRTSSCGRS